MILQIPRLIRRLLPHGVPLKDLNVIRIETTVAVYLVFEAQNDVPRWAVRIGTADTIARQHDILRRIHSRAPGLVAEPIICEELEGEGWVRIESGLDGTPWFALKRDLRTAEEWSTVRQRARVALGSLHAVIQQYPDWRVAVDPAAEMQRVLDLATRLEVASNAACRAAAAAREVLTGCGRIESYWQHGDFCLNNLVFADPGAAVIDFDEFGMTAMPLHDEFSLALSFDEIIPRTYNQSLADHLSFCLQPALGKVSWQVAYVQALFVHHLFWRLCRCAQLDRRRGAFLQLQQFVEQHVSRDEELFDNLREHRAVKNVDAIPVPRTP